MPAQCNLPVWPLANRQPILTTRPPLRQATSLRSIKALVPLLDRVLVQRIKAETKTASGIFLPESSVKELNEAKVLAVGPGALDKDGKRVPMGVAEGDKVLIPQVCLGDVGQGRRGILWGFTGFCWGTHG